MRTDTYQFTTADRNDPKIKELRAAIKASNALSPTKQYVKLQGRGHRCGVRRWNQSLPLDYATSYDVYVYVYERNIF